MKQQKHLHILGIGGTFMAGVALIAKQLGFRVTGTDHAVYPPMSDLLQQNNIFYHNGYDKHLFEDVPDLVVIGNALSRGNPLVEYVLDHRLPFCSGPAWLEQEVLAKKRVIAVSGTHGKTTTSSMIAWILEFAGLNPSFLIGGKAGNFDYSARVTDSAYFVIEADEYDTAFFDKRAKFVHYLPEIALINNLEFDHADIYPSLAAIQTQFHHLIRLVPSSGCVVVPEHQVSIDTVLEMGCWSPVMYFSKDSAYSYELIELDASVFDIKHAGQCARVNWSLWGMHNLQNALAAATVCHRLNIDLQTIADALSHFKSPARRMSHLATIAGIAVYEDFAHHPTAIAATLTAFRKRFKNNRLICILECRSNTMRRGDLLEDLPNSLSEADQVYLFNTLPVAWNEEALSAHLIGKLQQFHQRETLLNHLCETLGAGDIVIFMSNGSFDGIQEALPARLKGIHNLIEDKIVAS